MQAASDIPQDRVHQRSSRVRIASTLIVLTLCQLPVGGWLVRGEGLAAQIGREGVFWALALLLLAYVVLVEDRPLSSIGLQRPTGKTVLAGFLGALALLLIAALVVTVLLPALGLKMNEQGVAALKSAPLWFLMLVLIRAATFEEIYYRGFAIERLTEITGVRWLAALISIAGFTFAHLPYWGWTHLILAASGGIVLTALYLLRRDLAANMIAHFLFDCAGFLLS